MTSERRRCDAAANKRERSCSSRASHQWLPRSSEPAPLPPRNNPQGLSVGWRSFSSAHECVFYSIHKMTVVFGQLIEKTGRETFLLATKFHFSEVCWERSAGPIPGPGTGVRCLDPGSPRLGLATGEKAKVNAPLSALCASAVRLCSQLSIFDRQTKACAPQLFTCCSSSTTAFLNRIPPPIFSCRLKER
jgi:hypothetical protein